MKKLLIIFIVITAFGCQNNSYKGVDPLYKSLNNNNLKYFEIQSPNFYKHIPNYILLKQIDSLSNVMLVNLKQGNIINTKVFEEFIKTTNNVLVGYSDESKLLFNSLRSMENPKIIISRILEIEYICGNILINSYNQYLYKFRAVKAVALVDNNLISVGDTLVSKIYLAGIDPDNKFIAIIDKDTLPYTGNYVPIYKFVAHKKGYYTKKGKLLIKNPSNTKISIREFLIKIKVK